MSNPAKHTHAHCLAQAKSARALAFQHGSKGDIDNAAKHHRIADAWHAKAKARETNAHKSPYGTAKQHYTLPKRSSKNVKINIAKYKARHAPPAPEKTPPHLHKVPCSQCKTPHLRMNSHVTKSKSGKDVHTCTLCHNKKDTLGRNKHYVVPSTAGVEKHDWAPRDEIRLRWKKGKGPQAAKKVKKMKRKTNEDLLVEIAGFVDEIDHAKHAHALKRNIVQGKYAKHGADYNQPRDVVRIVKNGKTVSPKKISGKQKQIMRLGMTLTHRAKRS